MQPRCRSLRYAEFRRRSQRSIPRRQRQESGAYLCLRLCWTMLCLQQIAEKLDCLPPISNCRIPLSLSYLQEMLGGMCQMLGEGNNESCSSTVAGTESDLSSVFFNHALGHPQSQACTHIFLSRKKRQEDLLLRLRRNALTAIRYGNLNELSPLTR